MEGRRKSTRASSRAASVDSKKSKNEKKKDQSAASIDCDVESVSSGSNSMTECKVVLDRLSSASFNTRSRSKSTLTVDNVAAMDSPSKGKRSKVSESIASDDTGLSRNRASSRLSTTQNTPKKEAKSTASRAAAATPTRRTSRFGENIDLTNSPAICAKRTLRSSSVVSDDLPPASPSTRRSTRFSRLADSQGTPNKAIVESDSVMTPGRKGRASRLFTRQVQEIKEEEEEVMETVTIIELDDDSSQSSPKPKSKKRRAAQSETQTSNAASDASSMKTETVSADTMESMGKVLLVQTSTANLKELNKSPENVAQSGDSETVKTVNKSSDTIAEKAKPSHDLNVIAKPIASKQSDQTLSSEKLSVENQMPENAKNDAIIVDESTFDHQKVDSINVNSSDSGKLENAKPQLGESMESALVIDESANDAPVKGTEASTSKEKILLTKSPRADLDFMFQSTDKEFQVSSKLLSLTPKQMKESSVSGTDRPMQVEKSQTPKKESAKQSTNDLSLMNVTELFHFPETDTSAVKLPSNQSKSPKTQTPSKNMSELADMDVTNINSPSTSTIEKDVVTKELTPQKKSKATEPANILDSMNVTESVDSPKPGQIDKVAVKAIEKQSPKPKTMSPKQKVQTAEPTNPLDLMNVTELVNSPKPKKRNEIAAIEKQSPKPITPSKNVTESFGMDVPESSDANISGAKGIETGTPKKVSSKQNTPKSSPVSVKIATPKNKTPKSKTPSKDLNEFGDMNVTKLVEEVSAKSATPEKTEKNVAASVPETVTQNADSNERESANNQIAKSPASTKKTTSPKNSPLSSTLADQSINLNLEISQICESLQSPSEKTETKKPDIFAIPIDDGKTLDDTVEPMEVDQTQIGNMTSTSIDNQLDTDDNDVSSVSVSSRKSVQIMTPEAAKNTSGLNRLGTPYPDKKEIKAALAREDEIKNSADRFMSYVKEYQQRLKPLSESWNQSIKAGTSDIDKIDNKGDQVDEQPAKVAVPVRNNWSVTKGLIDSDSESEPETDHVSASENGGEQSGEESESSGFIIDKAEAVDDYESGDSEDEEDRQYREENELKQKTIELGSDDTDGSENVDDDDTSLDSFIVKDSDEETHDSNPGDSVGNEPVVNKRRFSRILMEETSSDEEEQVVSVAMSTVHQEVVLFGQDDQNDEENQIVEGKKFETTMFASNGQEESVSKKREKSNETAQISQNVSLAKSTDTSTTESTEATKDLENGSSVEEKADITIVAESKKERMKRDESNEPTTSQMPEEISATEAQPTTVPTENENTTVASAVQKDDKVELCHSKSDRNETVQESNESDVSTTSLKENETTQINIPKKTNRISLPGIKALPDSARKMAKEISRKSMGNLVSNQQASTVSPAQAVHNKPSLLKELTPKALKHDKPKKPLSEKIGIESDDIEANTSVKSIASKLASSQEENNNKKAVKESKARRLNEKNETHSTSQLFEEQDNVADAAVPCSSTSMMSVDSGNLKNSKKEKRKFVEEEVEAEPSTPPRPTKYLNIIQTRSGNFIEEPMTPEKTDRLGFKVTPMTPINKAFRIEKFNTNGTNEQINKSKKRKIVQIEEPAIVLPKPHWTVEQDNNGQPKKRARNILMGSTEVIIKPLNGKKRIKSARDLIPAELQRFRENNLYRAGIPRQDSRSLLMDRMKRILSQK